MIASTFIVAFTLLLGVIRGFDSFNAYGTSVGKLVMGYYVVGIVAGSLVGLSLKLGLGRLGMTMVGMLAGGLAFYAFKVVALDPAEYSGGAAVAAGILVGGILGFQSKSL